MDNELEDFLPTAVIDWSVERMAQADGWPSAELMDAMLIDDVPVDLSNTTSDPANAVHPSIWVTVPPDLGDYWSRAFPFDDPVCQWVYCWVGATDDAPCEPFCNNQNSGFDWAGAYLVSGLRPYIAYKIKKATHDELARTFSVRVWVGMMHHFSFFVPPFLYLDHSQRWGLDVIREYATAEGDIWDVKSGRVDARGRFAGMFLGLATDLEVSTMWNSRLASWRRSYYSCDPTVSVEAGYPFSLSYEVPKTGEPTELCFSDRQVSHNDPDQMVAFLGTSVWGEVCVVSAGDQPRPTNRDIVAQAMASLLGDSPETSGRAQVAWTLRFNAKDYAGNARATKVTRTFSLGPENAQSVGSLIDEFDAVRTTAEARYVFREFDLEQLPVAAASPAISSEGCCTWEQSSLDANSLGRGISSTPDIAQAPGRPITSVIGAQDWPP